LKTLLGYDFDGKRKKMWLEEEKRAKLLTTLKGWIMSGLNERGIPFSEFESVTAKLCHAFLAVQGGKGDCCPRATGFSASDRRWYISTRTHHYSRQ
jgi:hypothetical protein